MRRTSLAARRHGNILIVTLLLLALFATIGLTIVYYTKDLSEQQRINIEAQSNGVLTFIDDGSMALNAYLNTLLFDAPAPQPGAQNPNFLWGHGLLRSMYGGGTNGTGGTTTAWDGVGNFHEIVALPTAGNFNRGHIINYGMLAQMGSPIKPEYSAVYGNAYVPKNAAYTYPDQNNLFLASWVPATGEVLVPSYHRPSSFGSLVPPGDPGTGPSGAPNPNWDKNPLGMYLSVRPRPFDNGGAASTFPYPPPNADGSYTGDVQNIPGSYHAVTNPKTGQVVAFVPYNDAVWTDIGLPPMTLLNGKTIKPLIAATVIDLDSMLNYNAHGNSSGTSGAGLGPWEVNLPLALNWTTPGSTTTDGQYLVNLQTTGGASGGTVYDYRQLGQTLPSYAAVPWYAYGGAINGSIGLYSYTSPNQALLYTTSPGYLSGYSSDNSTITNQYSNASSLTTATPADLQYLLMQYGAPPTQYKSLSFYSKPQPASIVGSQNNNPLYVSPGLPSPSQNTQNGYRMDNGGITSPSVSPPVSINRGMLTPYSFAYDVPGLSPNYINLPNATAGINPTLTMSGASNVLTGIALQNGGTPLFPIPTAAPGRTTDFVTGTWTNNRAALGPIDLNRPLADYRNVTTNSLDPGNMALPTSYVRFPLPNANPVMGKTGGTLASQAVIDRQQLAMSIFVRLVVASGADGSYQLVQGVGESIAFPSGPPGANTPQFAALRALAQLAANIVDYIDSDDISTAFVWNPANVNDPLNPINFQPLTIGTNVVFGVEKPRLVLNEAFAEVTNNPSDPAYNNPNNPKKVPASLNPYIRFWLELNNPTYLPTATTTTTTTPTGPLGAGAVSVYYNPGATWTNYSYFTGGAYNPYRLEIARAVPGSPTGTSLRDPIISAANVTGAVVGTVPDIIFNFSQAAANPLVQPSNGTANNASSYMILAAANTAPAHTPDWNPTTFPPGSNVVTGTPIPPGPGPSQPPPLQGNGSLSYSTQQLANVINNGNGKLRNNTGLEENVVLLRRLANPYLPPNDPNITTGPYPYNPNARPINPYITVDYMDFVPATDQIAYLPGPGNFNSRTGGTESHTQYPGQPASVGRVQPYAGWTQIVAAGSTSATTGTYNFAFPNSLVVPQTYPAQNGGTTNIQNTFGMVNSVTPGGPATATYIPGSGKLLNGTTQETIMTPFDWFPQMDRALMNSTELFNVSMGKPHEFTLRTIVPGGTDIQKFQYMAANTMNSGNPTLYRALDVLRTSPFVNQANTGVGMRVPGRININTIQDKRVWDALFDAQAGKNVFSTTDVSTMWNALMASRSPNNPANPLDGGPGLVQKYDPAGKPLKDAYGITYSTPVPGTTVYDRPNGANLDRPFLPFGAPAYSGGMAGGGGQPPFAFGLGSGLLTDTLLRTGGTANPLISSYESYLAGNPHPYQQAEVLRKIFNNTTTVSHSFAVWVTIGYFDYNMNAVGGTPVLGAEYFNNVPGDLRRKWFTVVDRSMVGLDPVNLTMDITDNLTMSVLSETTAGNPGPVIAPPSMGPVGQAVPPYLIPTSVGTWSSSGAIVIGTGATQETLIRSSPNPVTLAGTQYYVLKNPIKFYHWPGEMVSNLIPGNPGPQQGFYYTQPPYNNAIVLQPVRLQ